MSQETTRDEEEVIERSLQYTRTTRIGRSERFTSTAFDRAPTGPHLFRSKSTNAHSTTESATNESATNERKTNERATNQTVGRVLYTFPVEMEDVRDGDSFDAYVALEPNEIIPQEVINLNKEREAAFKAGDMRKGKSYARQMADKGYRKFEDKMGKKLKVRLKGIDAPENTMEFYEESIAALSNHLSGETLILHEYKIENGRNICDAYLDRDDHDGKETFVQKHMLFNGYAWCHHRLDGRPEFREWHRQAKIARRGLWQNPDPEAPWDFKRKYRRLFNFLKSRGRKGSSG